MSCIPYRHTNKQYTVLSEIMSKNMQTHKTDF